MRKAYEVAKLKGRRNPHARRLQKPLSAEEARELIQERVWKHFAEWMSGQTGPVIKDKLGPHSIPGTAPFFLWADRGKNGTVPGAVAQFIRKGTA